MERDTPVNVLLLRITPLASTVSADPGFSGSGLRPNSKPAVLCRIFNFYLMEVL